MVFSVACLVFGFLVLLFPLCLMASLYTVVAFHHPRVVLLGLPSSVLYTLDGFPSALTDSLFLVLYGLALTVSGVSAMSVVFDYRG